MNRFTRFLQELVSSHCSAAKRSLVLELWLKFWQCFVAPMAFHFMLLIDLARRFLYRAWTFCETGKRVILIHRKL